MGPGVQFYPHFAPSLAQENRLHVVRTLPPTDRVLEKGEYAYVKCPNITTMWIKLQAFSYLTNYHNDQNYFFLPLTDNGFDLSMWNESETKGKVTRDKMQQFIYDCNVNGKISENVLSGRNAVRNNIICASVCTLVCLVGFIALLAYWISFIGSRYYDAITARLLTYAWAIVLVFVITGCGLLFRYSRTRDRVFEISKFILTNPGIENIITHWNTTYFIPNGLYVVAPRNMTYLHFVLDCNLTFTLENHPYPFDLQKRVTR